MIELERPLPAQASGAGGWLVTLIDLVSLLLSFFLLMYAGSSLPSSAWQDTGHALRQAFAGSRDAEPPSLLKTEAEDPNAATDSATDHLAAVLARLLASDPQIACEEPMPALVRRTCRVVVDVLNDRLVIALPQERVFYTHSGQLKEEAAAVFAALGPHLNRLDRPLLIAVEASEATRPFSFQRGRAVRAALRERGAGPVVPLFVTTSRGKQARHQWQPCPAAAGLGSGGSVVVCLTGGGQ